jgi:mRNA-degrading endonuclease toxin of MazEF toxin-antitoxin module
VHTVTVGATTSTRRGSPTEVGFGVEEGLKGPCCVNLCNVFTVVQADLRQFVGTVDPKKVRAGTDMPAASCHSGRFTWGT